MNGVTAGLEERSGKEIREKGSAENGVGRYVGTGRWKSEQKGVWNYRTEDRKMVL